MKIPEEKASELLSEAMFSKKESKRTTFKLSKIGVEALDWLTENYNLKTKEAFDFICSKDRIIKHALDFAIKHAEEKSTNYIRKTYVISKNSLTILNKTSDNEGVSRDLLVEYLLLIYKMILEEAQKTERENEEKVLEMMKKLWSDAEDVLKQTSELLSDDNPIIDRVGYISIHIENLVTEIENKFEDGTPIDLN